MKKVIKFIENNLLGLLITIFLVGMLSLVLLIVTNNKYDNELFSLREENEILKNEVKEQRNQLTWNINVIDHFLEHGCTDPGIDIQMTEDGYLINGKLYTLEEGFEVYE